MGVLNFWGARLQLLLKSTWARMRQATENSNDLFSGSCLPHMRFENMGPIGLNPYVVFGDTWDFEGC